MEPTKASEASNFNEWAKLEIMGHQTFGGLVSEQTLAGSAFIRLDIPAIPGQAPQTKFFNPASVYCITPTSEEVARGIAQTIEHKPISRYDLPAEWRATATKAIAHNPLDSGTVRGYDALPDDDDSPDDEEPY